MFLFVPKQEQNIQCVVQKHLVCLIRLKINGIWIDFSLREEIQLQTIYLTKLPGKRKYAPMFGGS